MKPRKIFNFFCLFYLLSIIPLIPTCPVAASVEMGPAFHRNPILNQFIFFQFLPQRAQLAKSKFNLISSLTHSNIIRLRTTSNFNALSDMAVSHLTLNPKYNLNKQFEISFNIGVLSYWGGFLDSPVEWYHKTFNFPNGQRGYTKSNKVSYILGSFTESIVNRNKATSSLKDSSAMIRYQAIKTDKNSSFKNFTLSLAAGIEFPTGNQDYGTSNGTIDYGFAAYFEKELFTPNLYIYYLVSLIKLGELKNEQLTMPIKKLKKQHSLSFEWLPYKSFSLICQVDYESSPYKTPDNPFLGEAPATLVLGINFLKSSRKNSMWQFIFTEDISHKTTPDFTLQLGVFQGF